MKPIYISASAVRDFLACKKKLYYRIFRKEDGIEVPETPEAIRGKIVHSALANYWNDREKAIQVAVSESVSASLGEKGTAEVINSVNGFFEKFRVFLGDNDLIEHKFKVKLDNDVYLIGVFDRISAGKVFDWKTSKTAPSSINNDVQFMLYDFAFERVFGNKPAGVYYAGLVNGKILKYKRNNLYMDILMNDVIPDFINTIKSGVYTKNGVFTKACYMCEYKSVCLSGDDSNVMDSTNFT